MVYLEEQGEHELTQRSGDGGPTHLTVPGTIDDATDIPEHGIELLNTNISKEKFKRRSKDSTKPRRGIDDIQGATKGNRIVVKNAGNTNKAKENESIRSGKTDAISTRPTLMNDDNKSHGSIGSDAVAAVQSRTRLTKRKTETVKTPSTASPSPVVDVALSTATMKSISKKEQSSSLKVAARDVVYNGRPTPEKELRSTASKERHFDSKNTPIDIPQMFNESRLLSKNLPRKSSISGYDPSLVKPRLPRPKQDGKTTKFNTGSQDSEWMKAGRAFYFEERKRLKGLAQSQSFTSTKVLRKVESFNLPPSPSISNGDEEVEQVDALQNQHLDREVRFHSANEPLPYRQNVARKPGWSTELYEYMPLDHTQESLRLIRILPDLSTDGLIQSEMTHATLDKLYTCLSYVWGLPQKRREILINNRIFNVQPNLWSFLCIARLKYSATWFWIDALSIAQHNIDERNHQVMQMGRIYERAEKVVAWLGNRAFVQSFFTVIDDYWMSDAYYDDPLLWRKRLLESYTGYEELKHLDYWSRAWITQELLLAESLVFLVGEVAIGFDALTEFMNFMGLVDFELFGPLQRLKSGPQRKYHLMTLLHLFQGQCCTVERDKVYSLLSLCIEGHNIEVNYDTSEITFVKHVLKVCRSAACLCSAGLLSAALSVWTSPLFDVLYRNQSPLLEVNIRRRKIEHRHTADDTSYDGEATELSLSTREMAKCSGCGIWLAIPHNAPDCRLICLADVCSANEGHLVWYHSESGATKIVLSQQDELDGLCHFCPVVGGIYVMKQEQNDTVTLGFSLEALLSRSWCTYRDQLILSGQGLPSSIQRLCWRSQREVTLFTICDE